MCIVCAMYAVCYMYCVCCMCCSYDIYYRICVLHVLSIECNIIHIVCILCVLHGYIHLCLFRLMCAFATLSGYEYDRKRKTEKKSLIFIYIFLHLILSHCSENNLICMQISFLVKSILHYFHDIIVLC